MHSRCGNRELHPGVEAAIAAPIPPAVEAMIREAGSDVETVAKVARRSHPDSAAEIDALVARMAARRAADKQARSLRASFDVIHENDPPPGRRATDTATRLSLVYGF